MKSEFLKVNVEIITLQNSFLFIIILKLFKLTSSLILDGSKEISFSFHTKAFVLQSKHNICI